MLQLQKQCVGVKLYFVSLRKDKQGLRLCCFCAICEIKAVLRLWDGTAINLVRLKWRVCGGEHFMLHAPHRSCSSFNYILV